MSLVILSGGARLDVIDPSDRGLAYGDGLFETLLVHAGAPVWWDAHWARLARGAARLDIPLPEQGQVRREVEVLIAQQAHAVLKLLLTRGAGGRGYAPPAHPAPVLVASVHLPPPPPPPGGLHLRWCDTRLAVQPALAGIKHCNRLEQVLARAEWTDATIHEGLMRDTEGDVISATVANLFALIDGRWRTPPVDRCGVAGVCREWLLAHIGAEQARLSVTQVEAADALFLCNAVRGILPVARLGARRWEDHSPTLEVMRRLADAEPAFRPVASESM